MDERARPQLAQEKSEAVLVTKRTKFEYPKLVLDGHTIQFQDSIRYLGLWIDKHWNFKDHIRRTSIKAGNVGAALQQLMPNVGGPNQGSRALGDCGELGATQPLATVGFPRAQQRSHEEYGPSTAPNGTSSYQRIPHHITGRNLASCRNGSDMATR